MDISPVYDFVTNAWILSLREPTGFNSLILPGPNKTEEAVRGWGQEPGIPMQLIEIASQIPFMLDKSDKRTPVCKRSANIHVWINGCSCFDIRIRRSCPDLHAVVLNGHPQNGFEPN